MDRAFLEQLGLDVTEADGVVEAELVLQGGQALNPLTRKVIERVSFTIMGDRLLYVGPPEFVGAQPINVAYLSPNSRLEDLITQTLTDHLFQLERRSNELSALGISPRVDPSTLQLTAELEKAPLKFTIGASRTGQFRIMRTLNDGVELTNAGQNVFELSEFFDKRALEDFLFALFSDVVATPEEPPEPVGSATITSSPSLLVAASSAQALSFRELFDAFGDAKLPPRSPLEVVADINVKGQRLRFAAARVQGSTFRGMLAGPTGKIWADRFELDEFPGIKGFISELMGVPYDDVEVS